VIGTESYPVLFIPASLI